MNVQPNEHPKPVGCLAKDIPVMFMYAGRQFVYTSTFEQCNFKAVTHKCALHHTLSLQPVPGNPISGSEYDLEMGPMHLDTHRKRKTEFRDITAACTKHLHPDPKV